MYYLMWIRANAGFRDLIKKVEMMMENIGNVNGIDPIQQKVLEV